jgi:hypothetical protein
LRVTQARARRVEDMLESMGRSLVPVANELEAERQRVVEAVNRGLAFARRARRARVVQRWVLASVTAVLCVSGGLAFAHLRATAAPAQRHPSARSNRLERGDALRTDAQLRDPAQRVE